MMCDSLDSGTPSSGLGAVLGHSEKSNCVVVCDFLGFSTNSCW